MKGGDKKIRSLYMMRFLGIKHKRIERENNNMNQFMTKMYVKGNMQLENVKERIMKNEDGSQSLEWLGIAAVVVVLAAALVKVFGGNVGTEIGEKIGDVFKGLADKLKLN